MLKRILISVVCLLCSFVSRGEGRMQPDSTVLDALTAKLHEYFEAMKHEPLDAQKAECDFLIESTSDSLIRSHIARTIYDYYIDNPVMGVEAVALHVYDRWFQPGLVKMSDMELMAARMFAEFNRQIRRLASESFIFMIRAVRTAESSPCCSVIFSRQNLSRLSSMLYIPVTAVGNG